VKTLDRKLWRDLWSLRGQVVTIALLVATGVTVLVGSVSSYLSLLSAQDEFYRESRFADIWAAVKRAPRSLLPKLNEISGVGVVEPRVVKDVRVDWPQSEALVSGRMMSLPEDGQSALNRLSIAVGRSIDPRQRDEVVINQAFAESWEIKPGDDIDVILNGRAQKFRIVGIANSPEFLYAARPGNPLPDDRTFVVLWAGEKAIAAAFDMEGAFNAIAASLAPGVEAARVVADLDRILEPYGAIGAYGRNDQSSHRFLSDELTEQRTLALIVPAVFFAVGAFLLNVVLTRLIETQREQIAALKALGFPSGAIVWHYAKFVSVIALLGAAAGAIMGARYGQGMINNYRPFFRFPELAYVLPPWLPAAGVAASLVSALSAAAFALHRVLRLAPAEAMRTPVPATSRFAMLEGARLRRWSPVAKMVWRAIFGRPIRSIFTVVGLALSIPMVVLGLFWWDALAYMVDVQFHFVDRGDATVAFDDAVSDRAIREIAHLPDVVAVEGLRSTPVKLTAGHRSYRMSLTGLDANAALRAPRDMTLAATPLPLEGLLMTRGLAERLGVAPGSVVVVESLEGRRRVFELPVAAIVDEPLGYNAYIEIGRLNALLREGKVVTQVVVRADAGRAETVWRSLAERPRVLATAVKSTWLRVFDEKIKDLVVLSAVVLTIFGAITAVGIVYNAARIAFQERAWELASLRVLGFTRAEVSWILLSELGVQIVVAIPLGLALAQWIVELILAARSNESFTIPAVISVATFAAATLVIVAAAAASALIVKRRIDELDLVGVLKARE